MSPAVSRVNDGAPIFSSFLKGGKPPFTFCLITNLVALSFNWSVRNPLTPLSKSYDAPKDITPNESVTRDATTVYILPVYLICTPGTPPGNVSLLKANLSRSGKGGMISPLIALIKLSRICKSVRYAPPVIFTTKPIVLVVAASIAIKTISCSVPLMLSLTPTLSPTCTGAIFDENPNAT